MCAEAQKKKNGFSLGGHINFAGHHCSSDDLLDETTPTKETLDNEFSTSWKIFCPCIGTASNANLSGPQKELLLCHWKLEISMYHIQDLMKPIEAHKFLGVCHIMPPVITHLFKSTSIIKKSPLCQSFQLAHSMDHVPQVKQPTKDQQEQAGTLSWDAFEARNFVSADKYVVNIPGRLLLVMAKNNPKVHIIMTLFSWWCYWSFLDWESSLTWSWWNFDS